MPDRSCGVEPLSYRALPVPYRTGARGFASGSIRLKRPSSSPPSRGATRRRHRPLGGERPGVASDSRDDEDRGSRDGGAPQEGPPEHLRFHVDCPGRRACAGASLGVASSSLGGGRGAGPSGAHRQPSRPKRPSPSRRCPMRDEAVDAMGGRRGQGRAGATRRAVRMEGPCSIAPRRPAAGGGPRAGVLRVVGRAGAAETRRRA